MAGWGRLQQMCGRWQDTNGGARCVNQFEYVRIRTNRSPAIYATLITRHLPMASIDSFMRERRRYHEPRRYAAQRQRQGRRSSSAPGYLLSACLIGALAGGGWSLTDPDRRQAFVANASDVAVDVGIMRQRAPQEGDSLRQCADARAAGSAPVSRGDEGSPEGMERGRGGKDRKGGGGGKSGCGVVEHGG